MRGVVCAEVDLAGEGEGCPAVELVVKSGRGELGAVEEAAVVEHLAGCTACAAGWRVARSIVRSRRESVPARD